MFYFAKIKDFKKFVIKYEKLLSKKWNTTKRCLFLLLIIDKFFYHMFKFQLGKITKEKKRKEQK